MAYHDFKILKQSVSIPQVLGHRGLLDHFKVRGDKLVGPCPVHGGDNPNAFVVSLERDLWHCYAQPPVMLSEEVGGFSAPARWPAATTHNYRRFSRAMSLSGGVKLPFRRLGGTTASRVSSFSTGSARR